MDGNSPSRQTVIIDRTSDSNVQRCYQLQRFAATILKAIEDQGEKAPEHYVKTAASESFQVNLAFAKKKYPIEDIDDEDGHVPQEWFEAGDRKLSAQLGLLTKWRKSLGNTGESEAPAVTASPQETADVTLENAPHAPPAIPSPSHAAFTGQHSETPNTAPWQQAADTTTTFAFAPPSPGTGHSYSALAGHQSGTLAAASTGDATAIIDSLLEKLRGRAPAEGGPPQASSSASTMPQTGATVGNAPTFGSVPPGAYPAEEAEEPAQQLEQQTAEDAAQERANKELRRWYRQWYARHKEKKAAAERRAMADANTTPATPATPANPATPASVASFNVPAQVDDSLDAPATLTHSRRTNFPASFVDPSRVDDSLSLNEPETRKRLVDKRKSPAAAAASTLPVRAKGKPTWRP